ncbi:hypothetical protein ACP8Y2_12400 [Herpetosiphon llansteffanensis]
MDSFEPLRAAGLDVTFYQWDEEEVAGVIQYVQQRHSQDYSIQIPYFWYAKVTKPSNHPTYNLSQATTQEKIPRPLDSLVSKISLQIENRQACNWKIWDYIPGPVHHEFFCHYASLDALVPAILNYYCGEPTRIGDWVVPLNRHPELNPARVAAIIARARPTTLTQLEQHQTNHHQKRQAYWNRGMYDFLARQDPFRKQYLIIKHLSDPTRQLHLRRDCRAAWVICHNPAI